MAASPAKYTLTATVTAMQVTAAAAPEVIRWLSTLGVRAFTPPHASGVAFVADRSGTTITAALTDWIVVGSNGIPTRVSNATFTATYTKAK